MGFGILTVRNKKKKQEVRLLMSSNNGGIIYPWAPVEIR